MGKEYNAKEKYKYLIGQTIGNWTILDIVHDRKKPDAICKCCCGTVRPVNIQNLKHGLSKDCGCGRKRTLSNIFGKDLTGQRFGKLLVLELLPESNKNKRHVYRCLCDCGNETIVLGNSLVTNHTLSCGCLNSYFNMYISKYLKNKDIDFVPEFPVVIDNSRYRFDFFLPKYNLFIEYDGIQHFEQKGFSGDEEIDKINFEKTQYRDEIKNQYAKNQKINLLRIPYWDTKNIDAIIDNHLQRLSDGESFWVMTKQQSELQL